MTFDSRGRQGRAAVMGRPPRRRPMASPSDLHRQWLELVDTDGPFLAISPLKWVWLQGMPALSEDPKEALNYPRKDFETAWEAVDRGGGDAQTALDTYPVARDEWAE